MRRGPAIVIDNLTIHYGPLPAVDGVTFDVMPGEIFGLLGPNGSGKSSTLSAVAGVLSAATGSVHHFGRLGYVPQEIALYEELTIRDNLRFFGQLHGLRGSHRRKAIESALHTVQLLGRAGDRVGDLSGGLQRRANLACALLHDPDVLLLDEPTTALDPASRDILYGTLDGLRKAGKAVLLTTHHLDEAEQWCDRVGVLQQGSLAALGRPGELFREAHKRAVLLGQLRHDLAEHLEHAARAKLGRDVHFEVLGRSVRLEATTTERLGIALATLGGAGIDLESFRTPPACLDRLLNESDTEPVLLPFGDRREVAWAA